VIVVVVVKFRLLDTLVPASGQRTIYISNLVRLISGRGNSTRVRNVFCRNIISPPAAEAREEIAHS
jgi:hypothetical protein